MFRLFFWLLLLSKSSADKTFLYEDVLEVEDVGELEKSDNKILLIEFYSPYCGHCIAFKPHFIEAAKTLLAEHGDEIHVKAVSCAVHRELCSKWAIRGVPSMFVVPPGAEPLKDNAVALGQPELKWDNINKLLPTRPIGPNPPEDILSESKVLSNTAREVIEKSPADEDSGIDTKDSHKPSDDDDDLANNSPPRPKAGAALAKNRQRDMDKFKDQMKVKMQKQKPKGVKGAGNKKGPPVMPIDEDEGATPTMKGNKVQTAEFLERKRKYINFMKQQKKKNNKIVFDAGPGIPLGKPAFQKDVTKTKLVERIPAVKRVVRMGAEEQLILDCTMAIWHGLTFSVFKKGGSLTPAKQKALTNWLDLLDISLPPEWALHSLIYDLRQNIAYISERFENMKEVVDRYQIRRKYFSPTCGIKNKTLPAKLGCGYWRLFHVISVGIAEHRGGLNLIDIEARPVGTRTFSPEEAADTVRDYIAHFFHCEECAQSFLEDYDDCEKHRRCVRLSSDTYSASDEDWKEFAMWFWEVHNSLNVELVNEAADAELKKKQKAFLSRAGAGPGIASPETTIEALWPDMGDCLVCFNIDGTWNEAAVFRHLEETYWPDFDFDFDHMDNGLIWFEGDTPANRGLMYFLATALIVLFYFLQTSISTPHIQRSLWLAKNLGPQVAPKKRKL
ncbi:hypothetical protein FisN_21Lh070 [Fistulifera solaris]|uniref:Sulfhydryl oxidase n=1 Tax=Fistulifera solaris TaxID=1519565 RepID=A0A1Z5KJX6_FISSO|nr:hypothetical protein FisN_21Lh070 [Fistulifera solaris]|eukprot:GAX26603.1 hypothetical protein FisN_21Lh070 [Fistulifera solaris]